MVEKLSGVLELIMDNEARILKVKGYTDEFAIFFSMVLSNKNTYFIKLFFNKN
jgi:hypothetical protein